MIVASDGSGDFTTIQAAIDAIPINRKGQAVIYNKNGVYYEKVRIERPGVHLIGEDPLKTILTYDDHAKKIMSNGDVMHTFNSYTFYIGGPDFIAENMTFANSSGSGFIVGQAVAAYVDADRAAFKNCRFLGCQDTLFNGPLPNDPPARFLNLRHPVLNCGKEVPPYVRHYFENCYLKGDIDYIFGSATVVFNRCTLATNDRQMPVNGYIVAASTYPENPFGYVFLDCKLTGLAGPNSVYLGRPWRNHAKTAFLRCWMGEQIIDEGWHDWNKPEARQFVTFTEYHNHGPGAVSPNRVPWVKTLTDDEAKAYTIENILAGPDGWRPDLS
jgi:pectinesterase